MWSPTRIPEEFYDLQSDPHEIRNLVDNPAYAHELQRHRKILEAWIRETGDQGQYPESIGGLRGVLKLWGNKAVNPEYEKARAAR
jgi:N-sulfoglucosamine sulfohydrolase